MLNWLTGKPKADIPDLDLTALQIQRTKQIEQLKICNQNVVELHRNVEYLVNFPVNGTNFSLIITLPPQFPQEKPSVRITPSGVHPWLSDQGTIVGCSSLNSFVVHSDLGRIIKEIVDEFKRNPPTTVPVVPQHQHHYGVGYPYPVNPPGPGHPPLPGYNSQYFSQPPAGGSTGYMTGGVPMPTLPPMSSTYSSASSSRPTNAVFTKASNLSGTNTFGGPSTVPSTSVMASGSSSQSVFGGMAPPVPKGTVGSYTMPDIPATFPQLCDLSITELTELAQNESKLLEHLGQLPELQNVTRDRENLNEQIEAQAKQNLSIKPCIEDRKRIILEKYDLMNELRRQFDDSSKRQDQLQKMFEHSLQDNLKIAAMQAEEEAESIAEQFLEGEIGLNEFKKKYMEVRSRGHARRALEEQLGDFKF